MLDSSEPVNTSFHSCINPNINNRPLSYLHSGDVELHTCNNNIPFPRVSLNGADLDVGLTRVTAVHCLLNDSLDLRFTFRTNTVDTRAAYVAISRVRSSAALYTDSRTDLLAALGARDGAQMGAIDETLTRCGPGAICNNDSLDQATLCSYSIESLDWIAIFAPALIPSRARAYPPMKRRITAASATLKIADLRAAPTIDGRKLYPASAHTQ